MARNSNTELVINGIKVDSVNEYNVATALTNLGFEFAYQYYFGQRSIRGSQIIDFLVYTTPKPTPLFVHGEYWHSGRYGIEEVLKEADIRQKTRGGWSPTVIIWEHECETVESATKAIHEKLGYN